MLVNSDRTWLPSPEMAPIVNNFLSRSQAVFASTPNTFDSCITVGGMVIITRGMLMSIMSLVVTYLMLILKFR